jgi:hypothetical protein
MLVSSFNLSQSFNYRPYLFTKNGKNQRSIFLYMDPAVIVRPYWQNTDPYVIMPHYQGYGSETCIKSHLGMFWGWSMEGGGISSKVIQTFLVAFTHGLINFVDTKAKFRHLKKFSWKGTFQQVFIRLRPPPLLGFSLGWCSNFVGSESGQIQSVKLLQNMVSNRDSTSATL